MLDRGPAGGVDDVRCQLVLIDPAYGGVLEGQHMVAVYGAVVTKVGDHVRAMAVVERRQWDSIVYDDAERGLAVSAQGVFSGGAWWEPDAREFPRCVVRIVPSHDQEGARRATEQRAQLGPGWAALTVHAASRYKGRHRASSRSVTTEQACAF